MFNIKDQDPIEMHSLQDALSQFCLHYLKGDPLEGIDLGVSPGIVDLLIWSYCSDQGYNICGKVPKCSGCKLEKTCFLGIANTERGINKQRTIVYNAKVLVANELRKPYLEVQVTAKNQYINQHPVIPKDQIDFFPPPGQEFELELSTGENIHVLMSTSPSMRGHMHGKP